MNKYKRILVIVLALLLVAIGVVPAFAASTPTIHYSEPLGASVVQTWNIGKPNDTDATATLDSDGLLLLTGTGDIDLTKCGWITTTDNPYAVQIKSVKFEGALKPTDMSNIFTDCSNLVVIDFGTLDLSDCLSMTGAFAGTKITSIDLSAFDTTKVKDWSETFAACTALTTANIANAISDEATTTLMMFAGCTALTSVNLTNCNLAKVTNANGMFSSTSLATLDLAGTNLGTADNFDSSGYLAFLYDVPTLATVNVDKNVALPEDSYFTWNSKGKVFWISTAAPLNITGAMSDSLKAYVIMCQRSDNRSITYNGEPTKNMWHMITFDPNGGSMIGRDYYLIANDGYPIRPTDPVRTGYDFVFWHEKDVATAFDFSQTVTRDINLIAQWKESSSSSSSTPSSSGATSSSSTPPSSSSSTPASSSSSTPASSSSSTPTSSSTTTTSSSSKPINPDVQYTVNFVTGNNDGDGSKFADGRYSKVQRVYENGVVVNPGKPIDYYGYTFDHWSTKKAEDWTTATDDSTGTWNLNTPVTSNLTIYAVYAETNNDSAFYTVTFDYNGGKYKGKSSKEEHVRKKTKVSKPSYTPKKDDNDFEGWYTGTTKDDDKFDFDEKITEDTTVYARWSKQFSSSSSKSSSSSSSSSKSSSMLNSSSSSNAALNQLLKDLGFTDEEIDKMTKEGISGNGVPKTGVESNTLLLLFVWVTIGIAAFLSIRKLHVK